MRLLVLGGTAWLGRYIATTAVERGHRVTCLARGESGAPPPGAAFTRADRDGTGAYREVAREEWDVVIDVSRHPGQVQRATATLADRAGSLVFVSSTNAYADHATPGADENAALLPALAGDVMASMDTYGQAKVACEQHVLSGFGPGRSLIARVGLIGGPGDTFDRTGYWPVRFRRPAAGHTGPVVAAGQGWLIAHDVQPWMDERSLPLWLPMPEYAGFSSRDGSAAKAAGLTTRPLAETLADTLAWELGRNLQGPRRAGLSDHEERRLLHALTAA